MGWQEKSCNSYFPITCGLLRSRPELDPASFRWPPGVSTESVQKGRNPPVLMVNIYQALPNSTIFAHFGTHSRLVASLGLKTPPGVVLRVGGEERSWEAGKWMLFDDSFEHEVVHRGTEPRYVLAVAMLHPDCCSGCRAGKQAGIPLHRKPSLTITSFLAIPVQHIGEENSNGREFEMHRTAASRFDIWNTMIYCIGLQFHVHLGVQTISCKCIL